jgi:predicted amidophosphoribosyltransferase
LSPKEREENVKGSFGVADAAEVRGKRVLLIDDVMTTGSTVNECARELLKAGAGEVDVFTLARAI